MLTQNAADFFAPLIKTLCKDVTISVEDPPESFNLSHFRKLRLNFGASDLRTWYYALVNTQLQMDLSRKIINVEPSDVAKDKILLIKTSRYCNLFTDWAALKPYADKLLFIGLDEEHEAFCKQFFPVNRLPVKDALEVAQAMAGALLTVGNPSGLYAIAEQSKAKRCLVTPEFIKWKEYTVGRTCKCDTSRRRVRHGAEHI